MSSSSHVIHSSSVAIGGGIRNNKERRLRSRMVGGLMSLALPDEPHFKRPRTASYTKPAASITVHGLDDLKPVDSPEPEADGSVHSDNAEVSAAELLAYAELVPNEEGGEAGMPMPADESTPSYYTCNQCNKFFWTESSMRHHYSLYHSEKAFVCEICGKAFRFRSNLAEHRSVHTSVKPYVCKYCGKSSRLKGNLTKHILKHHKQETNAVVGKEDIIIKKGKKSVKDPKCIDFLEKSMIVLTQPPRELLMPSGTAPRKSGSGGRNRQRSLTALDLHATDLQEPLPVCAPNTLGIADDGGDDEDEEDSFDDMIASSFPMSFGNTHSAPTSRATSKSIQSSVDAIIESALHGACSMPVENCIPATTLLESALRANGTNRDAFLNGGSDSRDRDDASQSLRALLADFTAPTTTNTPPSQQVTNDGDIDWQNGCLNDSSYLSGGVGAQNTQCPMCGKHFRKASNLVMHMRMKHPEEDLSVLPSHIELDDANTTDDKTVNGTTGNYIATSIPSITSKLLGGAAAGLGGVHDLSASRSSATGITYARPVQTGADAPLTGFTEKLSTLNGCQKDLHEIRELLGVLKELCVVSSPKFETLLLSLDGRVSRVERQMEASLSTLGTLIQVQTSLNLALCQFKDEIMQKVAGIAEQLKLCGVSVVPSSGSS